MFKIPAGTSIQVYAPLGKLNGKNGVKEAGFFLYDHAPWKPYVTKKDRLYEKEEVFDAVRLHNDSGASDIPMWIRQNVQLGKTVIQKGDYYALVKPSDLIYLD